jgi:hypothetical protein
MKHTVTVYSKSYEVTVYQKSKTVWEAVGQFTEVLAVPGETSREIRVAASSETAALKKWIEAARYWGN